MSMPTVVVQTAYFELDANFRATSSARPISGAIAPRSMEIPARERPPSHGQ